MRFFNILLASMILSAAFGTALASMNGESSAVRRAESLGPAVTWLWQPQLRRVATR